MPGTPLDDLKKIVRYYFRRWLRLLYGTYKPGRPARRLRNCPGRDEGERSEVEEVTFERVRGLF